MLRQIVKDESFLSKVSESATVMDLSVAVDLKDTLTAHANECVGMAGNMIGFLKRVIIFDNNGKQQVMFNPEIIKCRNPYQTSEGCLSLQGQRSAIRYKNIRVKFFDEQFQEKIDNFCNFTAQIIQHEIDHLNGIII